MLGNNKYVISLTGIIKNTDNKECTLPIQNGKVFVALFENNPMWIDIYWLSIVSHFELKLYGKHNTHLWNVKIIPINIPQFASISRYKIIFPKPLWIKDKYRVIPGFTHLAVDELGNFLKRNHKTQQWEEYATPDLPEDKSRYPAIQVWDPDNNKSRNILIHRLVAMAWCVNRKPLDYNVVNHINGNKHDYRAKNLEWCNAKWNVRHAIESGLRPDAAPCKLRNAISGEILNFYTVTDACRFLGMDRTNVSVLTGLRVGRLIKNQFEFRLDSDPTPWNYVDGKEVKNGRYIATITTGDQVQETYYDTRDIVKKYKLWNLPTYSIECIRDNLIARNPTWKMTWVDQYYNGPYQAYCVETGKIVEHETMRGLAALVGATFSLVRSNILKGETRVTDGYAYRVKTNKPWNTNFETPVSRAKCIRATNSLTKEIIDFSSIRAVARHFNVDKTVIKNRLLLNTKLNAWEFKEVTN